MVQLLFYLVTGVLIISAAAWWTGSVYEIYLAGDRPPSLGTVEIHGGAATDYALLEKALPNMVLSELNALQQRANVAIAALRAARQTIGTQALTPADTRFQEVEIPSRLVEPIQIEVKIADVDVGNLLTWLFKRSGDHNQLKLYVLFDAAGTSSRIYGSVNGRPLYSFSIVSDGSTENVVRAIAGAIVQKEAIRTDPNLVAVDASAISKLIDNLNDFASLGKATLLSATARKDRSRDIYNELSDEASKYTAWPELQWLAARVAEDAELWAPSLSHYRNLLAFYDNPPEGSTVNQDRRREIENKIAAIELMIASAAHPGPPESPVNLNVAETWSKALQSIRATSESETSAVAASLQLPKRLSALGIGIGVFGEPSQRVGEAIRQEPAPENADGFSATAFDDYVSSVVQAVLTVAEGPEVVFTGPTAERGTESEILAGLDMLVEEGTKVVLITFGGATTPRDLETAIREIAKQRITILAAGNLGRESGYSSLSDIALVVQALGPDNLAADFTSTASDGIWAPGVNIPYVSLVNGESTKGSGTSFAAALVAGVAAGLSAEFPNASSAQIVSAIRSASGGPPEKPTPLTYPAAKTQLEALLKPQ